MSNGLAGQVVATLKQRGETLAFCESLTAGLAAATVATVPGASAVLRGGLVTYATELKHELAGVRQETLATLGPVAELTAREMAAGTRDRLHATWAVALTGVAGPDEQDGHPVGEVWVAVAGPGGITSGRAGGIDAGAGREAIRTAAVAAGLTALLAAVAGVTGGGGAAS